MIYKIIFSIAIFILNFMIIKDEISNYSKEAKIMLLLLSMLWFPAFFMETKVAVNVMMITMLMCVFLHSMLGNGFNAFFKRNNE